MAKLKKALEDIGGNIWFFIELEPFRTVYTLALCGGEPCVVISGQDMSPVYMSLDRYLAVEDDRLKIKSLDYTIRYLLEKFDVYPSGESLH
ncbi:MAG: hypothetical protein ACK4SY_04580 [Pyrobaculum sp.]